MRKIAFFFLVSLALAVSAQNEKKSFSLEDIFSTRKFSSRGGFSGKSMNDGQHFVQVKKDSLNVYDYVTGNLVRTLLTASSIVPQGDTTKIDISSFEFSENESRILFANDAEPIYRYSSYANYYLYDLKSKVLSPLSKKGKQRLAEFSPDGESIAFVQDNNLYVASLDKDGKVINETQITSDGKINEIINGATDWVYEEEFVFTTAFFWSPDSKKLAFYRFDERAVKEFQLTFYGDLYPEQYKFKYPKPGEANSVISLFIANLEDGSLIKVNTGEETDIYIPRMKWTKDPSLLSFYRMNRHQNKLELMFADASTGQTRTVYKEEDKYYIDINDDLNFLDNNKGFILTSEKDGYNHIYIFDMAGKQLKQLTSGNWEVKHLVSVDEKNQKIWYLSHEISPLDKDLYSIGIDGRNKKRITQGSGNNYIMMNATGTMFVNKHTDINTPPVVALYDNNGDQVRMIQDNAALRKTMTEYSFGKVEFFKFKTTDGVTLNGWMLKPPDFDPSEKYPVMFTIYGGPGSQTVSNTYGMANTWDQYLAHQGIIMVSVDNRGTGGRGAEFKKMTYLQLGKYETLDQIEAAKYLSTLPYVDATRIGMWGWSYGGYLTLSCLTKGADYFSMGVAVAPVSNWKYYDNIYTERFMRTPQENPEGYEENSPINHTDLFKGKLLLIHGMADDNVHAQNSVDFITAMVASDKQFEMMFYPNSNHGIYTGKNTTLHLYKKIADFILKELKGEER